MARIELASGVLEDFDRILEFGVEVVDEDTPARVGEVLDTIRILAHSPRIGRPVRDGKRELVIGRQGRGFVALYRYVASVDRVFVLTLRSQREEGYKR